MKAAPGDGPLGRSSCLCFRTNNLIPPGSGFTLHNATAINDNGQIVANGYNSLGQEHTFLLTPGYGSWNPL